MLTGKQKALLLFSLLEDDNRKVLPFLSQESIDFITQSAEFETPEKNPKAILEVLKGIEPKRVRPVPQNTTSDTPQGISLSFGNDGLSGESGGLFADEPEEEKPPAPKPGELRLPEKIATILLKQKNQITAFVLSKIDEDLKEKILEKIPPQKREELEKINVANLPLSDVVFESLYKEIFIHKEEDDLLDIEAETENNAKTEENDDTPVDFSTMGSESLGMNFTMSSDESADSSFGFSSMEAPQEDKMREDSPWEKPL